ncbi:MAG: hypothetical protein ACQ9ET_00030 [Nitrosomonadaceae bacterium]
MDKLKTDINGGFPFDLDDLRWIADGIDQAFTGLGTGFSDGTEGDSFLLSGGVVTINASNLDVTEGYAYYLGEIIKIDAHSIVDAGTLKLHFWKLVEGFDSAGDEVFEDGSTNSTYRTRRLELTNEDIDATPVDPFFMTRAALDSNRLSDILADPALITANAASISALNATLTGILLGWQDRTFDAGDFTTGGTATYTITAGNVRFKRNGLTVMCQFRYDLNITGAGTVLLTAPFPEDLSWNGGFGTGLIQRAVQPVSDPEPCVMNITDTFSVFTLQLLDATTSVGTGSMTFSGQFTLELT